MSEEIMQAKADYKTLMDALMHGCRNPSYTMTEAAIENLIGAYGLYNLEDHGYIKFIGRNGCGNNDYLVRQ